MISDGRMISLGGINLQDTNYMEITITAGRRFSDDPNAHEIIVGNVVKEKTDAKLNDSIEYNSEEYKVVRFFETVNPNSYMSVFTHSML